ncbi:hypothetical protein ACFL4Z_01380 [candidate division KSB1 bacterium]
MNKRIINANNRVQYLIAAALAVVLIIILLAMITGSSENKYTAEWNSTGKVQNGVFIERDWFSVEVKDVNNAIAKKYNLPPDVKGVVVAEVEGNKDLTMKLRKGDLIRGINRTRIDDIRDFRNVSRKINANNGLLLDIVRSGYPMYVTIPGIDETTINNNQTARWQNSDPFQMTEIAPIFGKNLGTVTAFDGGGIGKEIENWINSNTGGYYACRKCGTMVPYNDNLKNKSIYCPNCGSVMILK